MNSNGTMFGNMCNPEAVSGVVYGHHHHHQSQHYASSDVGGSPGYCGSSTPVTSEAGPTSNHPYGLHAAAAAAAAAASVAASAASEVVNNNRSSSADGGGHSPTAPIISDNGLQYANLDGSGGPGYPGGGYGHHGGHMGGYHYSDIHGDGGLSAAAAAAAAASGQGSGISAYFDNSAAAAYAAQSQYPSIYGQHHPAHSLKSRTIADFSSSSYPADFAAAAAVSKPSPAVPTYKWMQVKRNVPKPGKDIAFFSVPCPEMIKRWQNCDDDY